MAACSTNQQPRALPTRTHIYNGACMLSTMQCLAVGGLFSTQDFPPLYAVAAAALASAGGQAPCPLVPC